jgi:hypothetical protein
LAEGDKNTHFFHQRASRQKKKNRISKLKRPDGMDSEDHAELREISRNFSELI